MIPVALALPEGFAAAVSVAFIFLLPLVAIWLLFVPRVLARSAGVFLLVGWATVMAIQISQLVMFE